MLKYELGLRPIFKSDPGNMSELCFNKPSKHKASAYAILPPNQYNINVLYS